MSEELKKFHYIVGFRGSFRCTLMAKNKEEAEQLAYDLFLNSTVSECKIEINDEDTF